MFGKVDTTETYHESFAAHVDLPKEKWFKYHPPIESNEEPVSVNCDALDLIVH